MSAVTEIERGSVIDDRPLSPLQIRAMLLCGLIALLDGNDTQAMAIAARPLAEALHVPPSAMGWAISGSFVGAAIGAMAMGTIADRIGPKKALVWAVLLFGVFTLATPLAAGLPSLVAVRVLAGIGLGGAAPCFVAQAAEYAPSRIRGAVVGIVWACFPLGLLLGGFVNGALLLRHSWEVVFYVGGAASLLAALLLVPLLPESLGFLLAREQGLPRARRILERIAPGAAPAVLRPAPAGECPRGVGVGTLLSDGRRTTTFCLWLLLFACFGTTASMSWLPTILLQHGVSLAAAAVTASFLGFGALVGMFGAGWLVDRFGIVRAIVAPILLGAVVTALMGLGIPSLVATAVSVSLVGALVGAGAAGGIALVARIYPPAMRSTGAGWALGMGRFGQVVMPGMVAVLLGHALEAGAVFLLLGIVPLIGAFAAWRLAHGLAHPAPATGAAAALGR